jgi:protocatechuate 3,4-dioxygenase beta subunit
MNLSIGFLNLRRPALPLIARILTLAGVAFATANLSADDQPAARPAANSPAATRTIVGRVVDSEGNPVGGAQVWWYVKWQPGFNVRVRTDGGGRFRLSTPADWEPVNPMQKEDLVWALGPAKDVAAALARDGLVTEGKPRELVLRLNRAKNVKIHVLDSEGQPLAGAIVEAARFRSTRGMDELVPDPIRAVFRATTDAAGNAQLHVGQASFSELRITAEPTGEQLVRLKPHEADGDRDVQLGGVGRIEGRVVAKDPQDARGVRIHFQSVTAMTEGVATAVTDERGNFVVPKLAWGRILVTSRPPDPSSPVRPRLPKDLSLRPGQTAHLEIPVERLVTVRGSVQTEDTHAPVAGATVGLASGNGMQGARAVTDSNGRFEVRVLPGLVNSPATGLLPTAIAQDYEQAGEPWNKKVNVPPGDEPFEMPPVVLVRRMTIRGQVVGEDGRPLEKASVCGDAGTRRYGFCETDEAGEFSMRIPRTVTLKNYEVWLPPHNTDTIVTVVKKNPLVLKAVVRRPVPIDHKP